MTTLPEALIFDCDGTLALTGELHWRAFEKAFQMQNAVFDYDFYHARGGFARPLLIKAWIEETGADLDHARLVEDSMNVAAEFAKSGQMVAPNPPVAALAKAWGPERPACVGSNGERIVVVATVEGLGLIENFTDVIAFDDVGVAKPAPDMFLLAAKRMGVAPENCLVLEDSQQGIEAAQAAGMDVIDVRLPEGIARVEAMLAALSAA